MPSFGRHLIVALIAAVGFVVPAAAAFAAAPPLPPANPHRDEASPLPRELNAADRKAYRAAFAAADRHAWSDVPVLVAGVKDRRLLPVLEWLKILRGGAMRPEEVERFIELELDFPYASSLAARLERAMLETRDKARIAAFFASRPAVTTDGLVAHALLLANGPAHDQAVEMARRAWREGDLGRGQEKDLRKAFGEAFTPDDHIARLDRLLWEGQRTAATRMKDLVGADRWKLADARLRLRYGDGGVDAAVARVPDWLLEDEGLVYERTRWRRRAGLDAGAQELLLAAPAPTKEQDRWWIERRIQVRELIAEGRFQDAYKVARDHGLDNGGSFAEGEFQAGWLALRFLDDSEAAVEHFRRLHDNVSYPISISRAAYWAGRGYERLGQQETAATWYERAAAHVSTYYGQLAAYRLGRGELGLPPVPPVPDAELRSFDQRATVEIVRLLAEIDEVRLARIFVTHLSQTAPSTTTRLMIGELGRRMGLPQLELVAGKTAALDHVLLPSIAYPVMAELSDNAAVHPALAHAIARQESAFDPAAVSSAGARGLMQLMPATAAQVAGAERIAYQPRRLTEDPAYNAQLGSAYLARQISDFGGYLPMAIAAYNAGPHRVRRWIREYGDPRAGEVDPIDWVELIPFTETRNYVQRVLEALQVYRLRLAGRLAGANGIGEDLGLDGADVAQCRAGQVASLTC